MLELLTRSLLTAKAILHSCLSSKRPTLKALGPLPPVHEPHQPRYYWLRASNCAAWRPNELNRKFRQTNPTVCMEKNAPSLFTMHLFPLKHTRVTPSAPVNWPSSANVSCSNLHLLKNESVFFSSPLVSSPIRRPRRTHTNPSSTAPRPAEQLSLRSTSPGAGPPVHSGRLQNIVTRV